MEKQKKKYGLEAWLPDKDADPYFGTARDMELYNKEKVIKQLRISNIGLIVCVSITVAAVVARLFLTLG